MKTFLTLLIILMAGASYVLAGSDVANDGDDSHVPPCPPSHEGGLQP